MSVHIYICQRIKAHIGLWLLESLCANPSCPSSPAPQEKTCPDALTARQWSWPQAIATTLPSPSTWAWKGGQKLHTYISNHKNLCLTDTHTHTMWNCYFYCALVDVLFHHWLRCDTETIPYLHPLWFLSALRGLNFRCLHWQQGNETETKLSEFVCVVSALVMLYNF